MNKWSKLIDRRSFLMRGSLFAGWVALTRLSARCAFAATHRYKLAPESLLPADILKAPIEVREAYRFAIANREVLRYIPCYCGCGEQGHTSNASCYVKDNSPLDKPEFDSMSLG